MSLINEALRKAQNQRTQAPQLGSSRGNQSANYAERSNRTGLMIGLGVCIVILIGLIGGLTVVLLSKDTPQTAQKPLSAEPETSVSEITPQPSLSEPATESTEPETKPLTPEISEQIPVIVETPTEVAEPSQEIIDWLEQSTVTGVRITSSSSKVILNNEAFMPGDNVNMNLGLKMLEIEPQRIILVGSNGVKYVKLF
jgi:cytoskeletal protein RodZ